MGSSRLSRLTAEIRRRQLPGVLLLYVIGAWAALQAADLLFPAWRIPDEAIRFVWIGAVVLLPVAAIFGWVYDVSARGIGRTPRSGDATLPLGRGDYGFLALLLLVTLAVIAGVGYQALALRSVDEPSLPPVRVPDRSIAVLPFVNLSGSDENEYFSDGISDQLLNELSKVPGLHVAARTSSFFFKGKNEPMPQVAAALGVRTLLEGSVQRAGDRVRITAQLINAEDGFHLWSETFDRDLHDIFAVQDEISRAIVDKLSIRLMASEQERLDRIPTANLAAFDLYLRAMAERETYSADAVDRSNKLLEEAIRLDPDFALAIDALAYGYVIETFYQTRTVDEAAELAAPLLASAIELQPDLEEAHASLGLLNNRLRRFDEANRNFETALSINPNYFGGLVNHGLNLVHQGRLKEASAYYFRAQSQDPLNSNLNFNLGALLMLMGEFDEGHRFIRKAAELAPDNQMVRASLTHWRAQYGHLVEAVLNGMAMAEDSPAFVPNLAALAKAYAQLGMLDEARQLAQRIDEVAADPASADDAWAAIWNAEGDVDAIVERATTAFDALDVSPGDALGMTDRNITYRYGIALLYQGRFDAAAAHLFWAAGGDDGIAAITYDDIFRIKPLALAYRRSGRDAMAGALLDRCLELATRAHDNGWSTPQLYARIAEIHAIAGDTGKALENLEIAVDKGWRELYQLDYGLYWQSLQDNDAFNDIKVRIIEDIERQKERLRIALSG